MEMAENETAARERCGSREQQQNKPTTIKMSGAKDETDGCVDIDSLMGLVHRVRSAARENGDDTTAQLPAIELLTTFSSRFHAMNRADGGRISKVGSTAAGTVQGLGMAGGSSTGAGAGAGVPPPPAMTDAVNLPEQAPAGEEEESSMFGVYGGGGGGGGGSGGASGGEGLDSQELSMAAIFLKAHNLREEGSGGNFTDRGGSGRGSGADLSISASRAPNLFNTGGREGGDAEAPQGASLGGGRGRGNISCSRRTGIIGLLDAARMATEGGGEGNGGAGMVDGTKLRVGDCSVRGGGSCGNGSGGDGGGGGNGGGASVSSTKGNGKPIIPVNGFDDDGNDVSKVENEAIKEAARDAYIDKLYAEERAIRDGTHPEMVRRRVFLEGEQHKKEVQIQRNVNRQKFLEQLKYNNHVAEIESDYEVAITKVRKEVEDEEAQATDANNMDTSSEDEGMVGAEAAKANAQADGQPAYDAEVQDEAPPAEPDQSSNNVEQPPRRAGAGRVGAITRSTSTAMDFPENLFNQAPHPKLVSSKSGNPGQATHAKKGAKNSAWKRRRVPRAKDLESQWSLELEKKELKADLVALRARGHIVQQHEAITPSLEAGASAAAILKAQAEAAAAAAKVTASAAVGVQEGATFGVDRGQVVMNDGGGGGGGGATSPRPRSSGGSRSGRSGSGSAVQTRTSSKRHFEGTTVGGGAAAALPREGTPAKGRVDEQTETKRRKIGRNPGNGEDGGVGGGGSVTNYKKRCYRHIDDDGHEDGCGYDTKVPKKSERATPRRSDRSRGGGGALRSERCRASPHSLPQRSSVLELPDTPTNALRASRLGAISGEGGVGGGGSSSSGGINKKKRCSSGGEHNDHDGGRQGVQKVAKRSEQATPRGVASSPNSASSAGGRSALKPLSQRSIVLQPRGSPARASRFDDLNANIPRRGGSSASGGEGKGVTPARRSSGRAGDGRCKTTGGGGGEAKAEPSGKGLGSH